LTSIPLRRWPKLVEADGVQWWRDNQVPILVAFGASLLLYSSIVTQFIFTDHTLPNIIVNNYPTYRTLFEGRWFADFLIWLGGGGGTPSFQSAAAFLLQAINGILFCDILRVRGTFNRILITLLTALHPALLDYHGFSIDAIGFTVGDSLILLSVLILDRRGASPLAWIASSVLFMLAIAIYPPKLAVFAVVVIGWLTARAASNDTDAKTVLRMTASGAVVFAGGIALYGGSLWLTLESTAAIGRGTNNSVNTLAEAIEQFIGSYSYVIDNFHRQWHGLPGGAGTASAILSGLGAVSLLLRSAKRGAIPVAVWLIGLALILPAINLSAIANKNSWLDNGRLSVGYTYCLAFLAAGGMVGRWPLYLARLLSVVILYGFFIIAVQENQFISTKSVFETSMMTRIAARIEDVLPNREVRPLVVIGETEFELGPHLLREPTRPLRPEFRLPTFVDYRQPQFTNFFLGQDIVRFPTDEERETAIRNSASRPVWPAPGSVYLDGETVVVNLDRPPS